MSVLDHFQHRVQVWNGLSFDYVAEDEAKKLEKAGTHQITTGLTSRQLKAAADFFTPKPKTKTRAVKAETGLPGVKKKQSYKTREMKAD